jgi:response regulator RpfG family c-di-GMP phosphodiesterase
VPWRSEQLLALAGVLLEKLAAQQRLARREQEVAQLSQNLVSTYEEISLLYTVTQNLRISRSDEELGELALDRLHECIPAEGFAIYYLGQPADEPRNLPDQREHTLIRSSDCPLDQSTFELLVEHLELERERRPYVVNGRTTAEAAWPFPRVRQLVIVPVSDGENLLGWIGAFNHCGGKEFGTVEANLLVSLGTLLGIHRSNRGLYRQQAEFLANVVRALVSAIDAKDPYTSGHSDRVARFAVRLALELRCDAKLVNTIYMAGLLHDVGKIGIDDHVLRKFEHIKLHPELGCRILSDLTQLSDVLPAVLHHHERWDGGGYPHGIAGEAIPRIARIMAVADAYDAMTSDRPYRTGMPDTKVDSIFRAGSGSHWDPEVVEAYFAAKTDILEIAQRSTDESRDLEQELV